MRIVIYCRISRDRAGAGLGVERQAQECRALAESLGHTDIEVLADNDLSAWSGKKRPDYQRLLAGLREGRWDTLICWHIDRLTRHPKDLETLVDVLNESRTVLHTVQGGEVDLTSAEGRMQARILGTLARYESDHKSDRIKGQKMQKAMAGQTFGGGRRYGWADDNRALDHAEADTVRRLTRGIITGLPVYRLATDLNTAGAPYRGGRPWTPSGIRKLVRRPRNAGLVVHRGAVLEDTRGDWEPIVTVEEWRAVCAVLDDPARRTSPGSTPRWLLSGIAVCGAEGCGAPMRAGVRHGNPIYRCARGFAPGESSRGHATVRTEVADDAVTVRVAAWLARDGVTFEDERPPAVDRGTELETLRVLVAQAEDALLGNPAEHLVGVSHAAVRRNLDRHRGRLVELEQAEILAALPGPMVGVTAENFPGLELERRRGVVDHLVAVTILPGVRGEDGVQVIPKEHHR